MTLKILILVNFILLLAGCGQVANSADTTANLIQENNDSPVKVSPCQLQNDPATYNHKLVEITGFFSHGFEDSTVFDPSCSSEQCIWTEYGGTAASGTMYCCEVTAERQRSKQLIVEEIPIPLVEDENFRVFDKLLHRPPDSIAQATVLGRFFSGKKMEFAKSSVWGGYGHMGMCSLLAIQKVNAVDSQERNDLDYRASDNPKELESANSYEILSPYESSKDIIELQQKAESGQREWSFQNPQQVAIEALARLSKIDEKSIIGIKQIRQSQGSFVYKWKNKSKKTDYLITVSRPYWLSFYAKDSKRVAWIVSAAYKIP